MKSYKLILCFLLAFIQVPCSEAQTPIRCFGDSFTQGVGANSQEAYPKKLHQLINLPTQNFGIGGATSADIYNAIIVNNYSKDYPTIIWSGYNDADYYSADFTISNIQSSINSLGHQRFLVLGVLNNCSRPQGTYGWNFTIDLNNRLKALYGQKFVDLRDSMVHYKSGDHYWDSVSIADDVPNHYLMADCKHCNAAGYNYVAQKVAERQAYLFNVLAMDSVRNTPRRNRQGNYVYEIFNSAGQYVSKITSKEIIPNPYNLISAANRYSYKITINGKVITRIIK